MHVNSPPGQLFKYVAPERISILKELLIRYTPPARFNDPFDMVPSIEALKDSDKHHAIEMACRAHYSRLVSSLGGAPAPPYWAYKADWMAGNQDRLEALDTSEFRRLAMESFRNQHADVGVLCLCAEPASLLMWAHYAQSHEGLLIGLRTSAMFAKPEELLIPVEYSSTRPTLNVGTSRENEEFAKKIAPYRVKSPEWNYELEWRAFARLSSSDKHIVVKGEHIHLFRVAPEAIRTVVMGYRISDLDEEKVLEAVSSNPELRHVEIQQKLMTRSSRCNMSLVRKTGPGATACSRRSGRARPAATISFSVGFRH